MTTSPILWILKAASCPTPLNPSRGLDVSSTTPLGPSTESTAIRWWDVARSTSMLGHIFLQLVFGCTFPSSTLNLYGGHTHQLNLREGSPQITQFDNRVGICCGCTAGFGVAGALSLFQWWWGRTDGGRFCGYSNSLVVITLWLFMHFQTK